LQIMGVLFSIAVEQYHDTGEVIMSKRVFAKSIDQLREEAMIEQKQEDEARRHGNASVSGTMLDEIIASGISINSLSKVIGASSLTLTYIAKGKTQRVSDRVFGKLHAFYEDWKAGKTSIKKTLRPAPPPAPKLDRALDFPPAEPRVAVKPKRGRKPGTGKPATGKPAAMKPTAAPGSLVDSEIILREIRNTEHRLNILMQMSELAALLRE
jgi:hypothetical protein